MKQNKNGYKRTIYNLKKMEIWPQGINAKAKTRRTKKEPSQI
jgi:hypothetical protein